MERRVYIVHGRVQGVGFRASTRGIARRFHITGIVRNLPNRTSVEIIIQGELTEIEAFFSAIQRQFAGHIDKMECQSVAVDPEETDFVIDF